jgi:hypothetical protein
VGGTSPELGESKLRSATSSLPHLQRLATASIARRISWNRLPHASLPPTLMTEPELSVVAMRSIGTSGVTRNDRQRHRGSSCRDRAARIARSTRRQRTRPCTWRSRKRTSCWSTISSMSLSNSSRREERTRPSSRQRATQQSDRATVDDLPRSREAPAHRLIEVLAPFSSTNAVAHRYWAGRRF